MGADLEIEVGNQKRRRIDTRKVPKNAVCGSHGVPGPNPLSQEWWLPKEWKHRYPLVQQPTTPTTPELGIGPNFPIHR